jgi:FAD dependent oxidoreductase TIGR03364
MSKSAIVIGAGIVGMATARALSEKGYKVTVFERNEKAVGASIRNFGMVWPVGQPLGHMYERAMRSRSIWQQLCSESGIWCDPVGSLLSAYHADELAAITEFYDKEKSHRPIRLLNKEQTLATSPATNPDKLLGALWSDTEIIVDPRQAIAELPAYLTSKYGIIFHFSKAVNRIEYPKVYSGKDIYEADQVFVCSGAEFETLYPEVFAASGITKCKLQMLRTVPQQWRTGPALSAGLTLTHYGAFQNLTTLAALNKRYNSELPEYVKWGIHVMISQNEFTEVTIGDSHEYGLVHDPFDREHINRLIMDYLKTFVILKDFSIAQTWHGIYPKLKGKTEFVAQPESGVTIINGLSGAGMTLSFGLAEEEVGRI